MFEKYQTTRLAFRIYVSIVFFSLEALYLQRWHRDMILWIRQHQNSANITIYITNISATG